MIYLTGNFETLFQELQYESLCCRLGNDDRCTLYWLGQP